MKPLLVLLFFGFIIVMFVGGALSQQDLTPDTPPAAGTTNNSGALLLAPQANDSALCASRYTVRAGDTLSQLAKTCSLALSDLIAANPQITNADLIYEGQVINIPRVSAPAANNPPPTATQAVVEAPPPTATQQVVEAAVPAAVEPTATGDAILSAFETARAPSSGGGNQAFTAATPRPTAGIAGLRPGSLVKVSVAGFPANVPVEIGIGQVGKDPFLIDESITDSQGVATVIVAVPANARNGERWTVTITTTKSNPKVSATAEPFTIGN